MRKIRNFILMGFLFLVPFHISAAGADLTNMVSATNVAGIFKGDYISNNYDSVPKIPNEYKFNPRYIPGVTTSKVIGNVSVENTDVAKLTEINTGILYSNVGTYNGTVVDMELMLVNFDDLGYQNTNSFSANCSLSSFDCHFFSGVEATMKYNFYIHNTKTPISIKGNMTIYDIEEGVYYSDSSVKNYYVGSSTTLKYKKVDNYSFFYSGETYDVDEHSWDNGIGPDQNHMLTLTFSGSTITQKYLINGQDANGGYLISSYPIVPIENKVNKYVRNSLDGGLLTSNTLSSRNDSFYYSIFVDATAMAPTYYFSDYTISDTLNEHLIIQEIKLYNELGNDVTSSFDISIDNNKFKAKAKNSANEAFYNHIYQVRIKTKINDNVKLTFNNNKFNFTNIANLTLTTKPFMNTGTISTKNLESNAVLTTLVTFVDKTTNPNTGDARFLTYGIISIALIGMIYILGKKLMKLSK